MIEDSQFDEPAFSSFMIFNSPKLELADELSCQSGLLSFECQPMGEFHVFLGGPTKKIMLFLQEVNL